MGIHGKHRPLVSRAAALALAVLIHAGAAQAACRQALLLALDVSGSVDADEYILQREGLAAALTAPSVRDVLLSTPQFPVYIAAFEWAGQFDQFTLLEWTPITDLATLDQVAKTLRAPTLRPASRSTALGASMAYAAALFRDAPPTCLQRTLDISGDGKNNDWPDPSSQQRKLEGVTINALVIGADNPAAGDQRQAEIAELSSYFLSEIIRGPGAFVETALGYSAYQAAMERKLLRELKTMVFGQIAPTAGRTTRTR